MTLVQLTVSGGILIVAIAMLRLFGGRLPRRLFHGLWTLAALRLLLPFSLPAPTSIYNLPPFAAADQSRAYLPQPVTGIAPALPNFAGGTQPAMAGIPAELTEKTSDIPLWLIVWLAVALILALCFLLTHLRGRRLYAQALPMENRTALAWLEAHPLKRRVALRCSDRIAAPLTYGLLRPVILLPAAMETAEEAQLIHVLTHEWVHIQRFDALYKLLLCAAVCLHWFNPAVWLLAVLAERDTELSCDEVVMAQLETEERSAYAKTLLALEERRGGLAPLGSHFSRSAIEARIRAILHYRKASAVAIVAAVLLALAVTAVFATSASRKSYAQINYAPLMTLRFDGYEELTVQEYRKAVLGQIGAALDEETYFRLFNGILGDETLRESAMTDKDAFFLMNTLRLTMMDNWREWYLDGSGVRGGIELGLEVQYHLTDPGAITVGQRDAALRGVVDGAWAYLEGKTPEALEMDSMAVSMGLSEELLQLEKLLETEAIDMDTRGGYSWLGDATQQERVRQQWEQEQQDIVEARGTPASRRDYDLVLALMAGDWQDVSVEEFSNRIFRAMEDERLVAAVERIAGDRAWNDRRVDLDITEQRLIQENWINAISENTALVRNDFSQEQLLPRHDEEWFVVRSVPAEIPGWEKNLTAFEAQAYFYFSWDIPDKSAVTVRERDERILAVRTEAILWLQSQSDDALAAEGADMNFRNKLTEICATHSDSRMVLTRQPCELRVTDNRQMMVQETDSMSAEEKREWGRSILREFQLAPEDYTLALLMEWQALLPEEDRETVTWLLENVGANGKKAPVFFLSRDKKSLLLVNQDGDAVCHLIEVKKAEDGIWDYGETRMAQAAQMY